jgi:hypothetical protein
MLSHDAKKNVYSVTLPWKIVLHMLGRAISFSFDNILELLIVQIAAA